MVLDLIIVAVVVLFIALDATRGFLQAFIDAAIAFGVTYYIVNANGNWRLPYCDLLPVNTFFGMFLGLLIIGMVGGYILYRVTLMQPLGAMEHVSGAILGLVTGVLVMRFFLLWGSYYQLPAYNECIHEQTVRERMDPEVAREACKDKEPWYLRWEESSALIDDIRDLEALAGLWSGTKGLRDPDLGGLRDADKQREQDRGYKEILRHNCIERVAVSEEAKAREERKRRDAEPKKFLAPPAPVGR